MKATTITEMPDEGAILDTLVAMEKGEKKRGRKKGGEKARKVKKCTQLKKHAQHREV